MANKSTNIHKVVSHLGLREYYPQKLTREKVFQVSENVISTKELNDDPHNIPWYMLQNLIMCNYEGRSFDLQESQSFSILQDDDDYDDDDDDESNNSNESIQVSPIDALVAIFLCCDNFLRQILFEKMAMCQLAIPLLMPVADVRDKTWELIVWGMSTIKKKWKTSSGSTEKSMAKTSLPIVSALRLGRPKISKSKIINCVINEQKHDIFFNSGCKGGNLERKISDGLLELAWYLPTQKTEDNFSDALTFINLRGNASDFQLQTQFLSEISLVTIAFVTSADLEESDAELLKSLYLQNGHVIFILDGRPGKDFKEVVRTVNDKTEVNKHVQYVMSSNKNTLKISAEVWKLLESYVKERHQTDVCDKSIENCIDLAKRMTYHVDEDLPECIEAKKNANELLICVTKSGKQNELPLQMVTVNIGDTEKEQHRLLDRGDMLIEEYRDKLEKDIVDLRVKQLTGHNSRRVPSTYNMFKASFATPLFKRKYFFGYVKIMTDRYSIEKLQPIRRKYIDRWNALCQQRKKKPKHSSDSMKKEVEILEETLSQNSLGLEHFSREIGQNFEMISKLQSQEMSSTSGLATATAEMLLHGYPVELMDGDAAYVPLTWIEAVFNSLRDQLGNKKMFVLSVLGIQSSGKSTMLNAMFGLQFSVSAGRCTKGIFAQLVSLDTGLSVKTQCDYILVVDTEGLRSPEFASVEMANNRDNELATLVIGLGDLTIINIMGENPTDMQDTLQIAVHAFMKMENVKIKPSCLFVHQNVTEITASDMNTTQKRKMREMLDKITKIAAEAENCSEKYESFSDVINFQENEHVMYISGLWQGDPPMAPPNPGYSQGILKVKKQILKFIADTDAKYIGDFTKLLSSLWKAILGQDFVFSFKNSLEITAFNNLNKEYVHHSRLFRIKAQEYSNELQNKCNKLQAEEFKEAGEKILSEYEQKLDKDIGEFKSKMAKYFEKNKKACQEWKFKMEKQINDVCEEVKQERLIDEYSSIKKKKNGRRVIDAKIKIQEEEINVKARQLADVCRHKPIGLSDNELKMEFTKNWKKWVSGIPPGDEYDNIQRSFQKIATKAFLDNNKSDVIDLLQYGDHRQTEVLEADMHFGKMAKITSWFGVGSKQNLVNQANLQKNQILNKLEKQILRPEQEGLKYTKTLGIQLLSELSNGLGEIKVEEKFGFTVHGKIRLAICNFKMLLIPSLEKLQEKHKLENDPKQYMECQKDRLWEMFKADCKGLHFVVKVSLAISRELTHAIQTSLPEKCKLGVMEYLGHSSGKGFSSKMSLHAWMLIEMAQKGNFQAFVQYLSDPIQCIKTFTSEQIEIICSQKNKTGHSLLQEIYGCKVRDIIQGLEKVVKSLSAKRTVTLKSWWPTFLEHTDKMFCVKADIGYLKQDRNLDLKELIDSLLLQLKDVEDTIIKAYDQTIFSKIRTFCCEFATEDLLKCQMMCPFCKTLCELVGGDHHRTECHRPQGVAGYHWTDSKKLLTELCTTSVMAGQTFINQHTNNEVVNYKDYKTVNDYYASWKIEPLDGESEKYWKWFMATYNTELAQYYKVKKADIPGGWKNITKEEAIKEMKEHYDI